MSKTEGMSNNTNSAKGRPGWYLLTELAARDLWFDRKVSICIAASLVAVIAPLLLLFGLKYGVVSHLRETLTKDPYNLEVRMLGNGQFSQAWFDGLKALPASGFVMPLTRSLNTQADLLRDSQHFVANAEVVPSGPGDPLLGGLMPPQSRTEVLISASASQHLGVRAGDSLRLLVLRQLKGQSERGQLEVQVKGVLTPEAFSRPAVLVSLDLLVAMEDFRDGFQVPLWGLDSGSPRPDSPRHFAKARLYATDLDQVEVLADWLSAQQIESITRQREIESVKAIDRVLGGIFAVVAWIAVMGCVASLSGAFLANIERKRRDLALLRLLGFRRSAAAGYVMLQAVLLTCVAFAIGYWAYVVGSHIFNQTLSVHLAEGSFVCKLEPIHLLIAFSSALLSASLVAAIGGYRAIQIQPAESLRDL